MVTPRDTAALRQLVLRPYLTVEQVLAEGDGGTNIGVYVDGVCVACASPREEPMPDDPREGDWRLRGMASHPDVRGQGYGALALTVTMDHARERGGRRMWANARTGALGFYLRHGFVTRGEEFDVPRIGPHYLIWRDL